MGAIDTRALQLVGDYQPRVCSETQRFRAKEREKTLISVDGALVALVPWAKPLQNLSLLWSKDCPKVSTSGSSAFRDIALIPWIFGLATPNLKSFDKSKRIANWSRTTPKTSILIILHLAQMYHKNSPRIAAESVARISVWRLNSVPD